MHVLDECIILLTMWVAILTFVMLGVLSAGALSRTWLPGEGVLQPVGRTWFQERGCYRRFGGWLPGERPLQPIERMWLPGKRVMHLVGRTWLLGERALQLVVRTWLPGERALQPIERTWLPAVGV